MTDTPDTGSLDTNLLRPSGALLAAQIALGGAIEREAVAGGPHDSTTLDLLIRLSLAPGHRLRAVELCGRLQLSPSHVSRMLDRAEASGLVAREPDVDDRRAKSVRITAAGLAAVSDFAPRLHAVLTDVIHDTLVPAEIETLIASLERIAAAASGCCTANEPTGAKPNHIDGKPNHIDGK